MKGYDIILEKKSLEDFNEECLWSASGGSSHFAKLLLDLHADFWFAIEGLNGIIVPKMGALAGTPFADLLFTYALAKLLKTAEGF